MTKQIVIVIAFAAVALLYSDTAAAQTRIARVQVCQRIGNIQGAGPVTCIHPIGDTQGRTGNTVGEGAEFFILVRFRDLPRGDYQMKVFYESGGEYGSGATKATKAISFRNQSWDWANWFRAHYTKAGSWKVTVSVPTGNGRVLQRTVSYCIGCFRGPE